MCCKENFIFVVISFHIFQAVSKPLTLVRLMRQASRAFNLNEHESERILYMLQTDWGGKPYHSLDYELKKQFGKKIYKISLDGGMTCPNRDGTLGTGGCIFCSAGGSGDFAENAPLPLRNRWISQKTVSDARYPEMTIPTSPTSSLTRTHMLRSLIWNSLSRRLSLSRRAAVFPSGQDRTVWEKIFWIFLRN